MSDPLCQWCLAEGLQVVAGRVDCEGCAICVDCYDSMMIDMTCDESE